MYKGDLGAEEYGPPAPTSTQLAVQEARDILTSKVPMTSSTFMYMVGGVLAAYLVYQYMYGSGSESSEA
jgi:hypothetical protein